MAVTAFASQNPLFSGLLRPEELLKEAYQDAGNKNPERFLNSPNDPMEAKIQSLVQQVQQQAQQVIGDYEKQIHELQKKLDIQKAVNDAKVAEAQMKAQSQISVSEFKAQQQAMLDTIKSENEANINRFNAILDAWKAGMTSKTPEVPDLESPQTEQNE